MAAPLDLAKFTAAFQHTLGELTNAKGPYPITEEEIRGTKFKCYGGVPNTLAEWYTSRFPLFADKTFIVYEKERLTFGQVQEQYHALAHTLLTKFKIQKGDRVAIAMRNYPEWCIAFFAITHIGAVAVPLNGWWSASELEYGLSDSGTKLIIADPERWKRAEGAARKFNIAAISIREEAKGTFFWTEALKLGKDKKAPIPKVDPEDNALIMYTSGTTGHPKGVVLTHRSVCQQMAQGTVLLTVLFKLTPPELLQTDVQPAIICAIPLFHVTASHHIFLQSLCTGRKMIIMAKWDAGTALELIEQEKVTMWTGVPTMVQDLMEHPDFKKRNISTLRSVGAGGAPTPVPQVARVEKNFRGGRPNQGYGLTETNGAICQIFPDFYLARPTSCGQPFGIVEIKVVDIDSGKELARNQPGELLIKSVLNLKEYWGKPKATKEALSNGWFRTGDVAKIDSDGYIHITDRAKDIIIRGGENISCAEVENAFYKHPSIMEATVFGIPDPRLGETVGIMVHLKSDQKVSDPRATAAELVKFVKADLAGFKIPPVDNVFFTTDPLPRGATGKIQKRDVKAEVLKKLQAASGSPKAKL